MTISARESYGLTDTQVRDLRARIGGEVLTADSFGYDDARKVVDITNDSHPLAIVRAADAIDVATAVSFARDNHLPLMVRSGGHSIARYSVGDDAFVIDLSQMKSISINPTERTARVQPGVTSGDLGGPANDYGLALSTGDTASVGMGGLTTGGGIGYMVRKYGLTIDHLLSAQVVTANGEIVTASETEHPDLFWAIRGGGGNFGIVTEFTYRMAPVGQVFGGDLVLPATPEVIRGYLEYSASAPDELSTLANIMYAPPAPFVPEEYVGTLVLWIIGVWAGDIEDGDRAFAPLRALATPVADVLRPMPYPEIYRSTEHQTMPHGFALRSTFANEVSDESIEAYLDAMAAPSSPYSIVHLRGLGGAMSRVTPDATAFAHRDYRYMVTVIAIWLDPAEDPAVHGAWAESLWNRIRHEGSGAYVNFLQREGKERLNDAYPPATLERLRAIKRTYDPGNLFRFNQNIEPRA